MAVVLGLAVEQDSPAMSNSNVGAPDDLPFTSVIIPVRDDDDGLRRCLEALRAQTYPDSRFEIVVVDDGSEPPVEAEVDTGVTLLRGAGAGSYAARNAGMSVARGEIFAFTDADCLPDAAWLERGVARLTSAGNRIVVAGAIELVPRGGGAVDVYELETALRQEEYVRVGSFGATANLFAARNAFDRAGLFDIALESGGDAEWCRRALRAGFPIVFEESARIRHPTRESAWAVWRRARRLSRGYETLAWEAGSFYVGPPRLHPPSGSPVVIDVLPPVRAARSLLANTSGQPRSARLGAVGVLVGAHYAGVLESVVAKLRLWRRRR
jgi:glycosyltransferase involved in cell wall biosynthesis